MKKKIIILLTSILLLTFLFHLDLAKNIATNSTNTGKYAYIPPVKLPPVPPPDQH